MDKIIRCITSDGCVMCSAVDTTDTVYTAQQIHHTSPAVTAALGRLLSASSLMGAMLKQANASITVKLQGNGPAGSIIAVADSHGNCKGYVTNPGATAENYDNGKLNVAGVVGKEGILYVMRDPGTGEPYVGQVPIISGEVAEDITNYYATSEQIPTVCALGVLLDKETHKVLLSGGLLIQLLPAAGEEVISKLEQSITQLEPITTLLAKGLSIEEICRLVLSGFELEVLEETPIGYYCNCSQERVLNALRLLDTKELRAMIVEDGGAQTQCHFCNKVYQISKQELQKILEEKEKNLSN